jgi:hypothetical protein
MASKGGPSDLLARLTEDELAEYIGDDDISGELSDGFILSPERWAVAVLSQERVRGVEDFPDCNLQIRPICPDRDQFPPWFAAKAMVEF